MTDKASLVTCELNSEGLLVFCAWRLRFQSSRRRLEWSPGGLRPLTLQSYKHHCIPTAEVLSALGFPLPAPSGTFLIYNLSLVKILLRCHIMPLLAVLSSWKWLPAADFILTSGLLMTQKHSRLRQASVCSHLLSVSGLLHPKAYMVNLDVWL